MQKSRNYPNSRSFAPVVISMVVVLIGLLSLFFASTPKPVKDQDPLTVTSSTGLYPESGFSQVGQTIQNAARVEDLIPNHDDQLQKAVTTDDLLQNRNF